LCSVAITRFPSRSPGRYSPVTESKKKYGRSALSLFFDKDFLYPGIKFIVSEKRDKKTQKKRKKKKRRRRRIRPRSYDMAWNLGLLDK
jgi:hypothetical protein